MPDLRSIVNIEEIYSKGENLNKKNFWGFASNHCTKTMNKFTRFIDVYKMSIGWDDMFNEHLNIKFHDIPYEMQLGIILKFFNEATNVQVRLSNVCDKRLTLFVLCDLFDQCELHFDTFTKNIISSSTSFDNFQS